MSTYERIDNTIEAEPWTGAPDDIARLVAFTGPGIIRSVQDFGAGPTLKFWCERSEAFLTLRLGGAIAAEADGSGFYPIAPDVFAERFRLVPDAQGDTTEPAPPATDPDAWGPVTDDELEATLLALETD